MQADQLKQSIMRIEQSVDEAKRAVQAGSVPNEVRQSVDSLHEQARQAQQSASGQQQMGADGMRQTVMQLEQSGDRAMEACRNAGSQVNPQAQQAIKKAHDEISSLKRQIQQG